MIVLSSKVGQGIRSLTQFIYCENIRNEKFRNIGQDLLGAQRGLALLRPNPMTGKWVTDPIVSPYVKFNNGQKFGFDFGHLLKGLIWGHEDQMMPRGPVRMGPPQQRR